MSGVAKNARIEGRERARVASLLTEGKGVLQRLRFIIQNRRPGAERAVVATLELASKATLDFAFAAHAPTTADLARKAARKRPWFPVPTGKMPPVVECLNSLRPLNTFQPRPRKHGVADGRRMAIAMLDVDIRNFWSSIVSPGDGMVPISDKVRAMLNDDEVRKDPNAYANAFLTWREECGLGFLLDQEGPLREICTRMKRHLGKLPGSDPARSGFLKLAREHFVPLLKNESN